LPSARPITETPPAPPGGEVAPLPERRRALPWLQLHVAWQGLSWRYAYRLLPFAPVALLALPAWSRRWTSEDAFIYYRIVDQLLAGNGPVFNAGERVEAYTGPLWLAVLAVARAVAPAGVELEWVSVAFGLALSAGGLLAAVLASRRLWSPASSGTAGRRALVLPVGALVVAALPPFWDFATSGLETGLVFAWLGGTFLGLLAVGIPARGERRRSRKRYGLAVAIGLGPLVRPDLTIFAAAFLVVLAILERPLSPWRALRLAAVAAAIPLVYQLFRMGYFGSLLPNTALAKEAGAAHWARGWSYLLDLLRPYALWLPVAALLGWAAVSARGPWRGSDRERALLAAAPVAAGTLHALYVVRLGGDYMHARMLLPGLFAVLMPVAVVAAKRRWATALLAAVIVPWAVVCALTLRAPAEPAKPPTDLQVNDQRRRYAEVWGYRDPVTLGDYAAVATMRPGLQVRQGRELAALAESKKAVVLSYTSDRNRFGERSRHPLPLEGVVPRPDSGSAVVARTGSIGRIGFAAGLGVHIVDRNGLADPLAARLRLPPRRPPRPGHEKNLPEEWALARFAVPTTEKGRRMLANDPDVQAARRALACAPLRELSAATTAPMSAGRFLANGAYALREPSLRFAPEPPVAARELCERW
jgi:arabinofuranosyltransferase